MVWPASLAKFGCSVFQRRDHFEIQDEETEFAARLDSCGGRWHGALPENPVVLSAFKTCLTIISLLVNHPK
jgi:hypothetical protein